MAAKSATNKKPVMKNRGKNINEILNPNNAPEDAKARALWCTMYARSLNKGRCTSPEEMEDRFNNLFKSCLEYNIIPTVEMLAICSGYDRKTLNDMEHVKHDGYAKYADVVRNAKEMLAGMDAILAMNNDMNSNVYKFRASNYYGLTERQEMVVTPNTGLQTPMNEEEILKNIPQLQENNG